jgi:beta-N-acetylhexosaminidase
MPNAQKPEESEGRAPLLSLKEEWMVPITRRMLAGFRGPYRLTAILCLAFLLTASVSRAKFEAVQTPPLEVKVGQMLMVGFRGLSADSDLAVIDDIRQRHIGGVILFDYDVVLGTPVRNIASAAQTKELIADLQSAAAIPLLVALDQEGGKVSRLKERNGFEPTLSPADLGAGPISRTLQEAGKIAATMAGLGFNINLAPVVDLDLHPENPVIGGLGRSFSSDPLQTVRHASAFIAAHRKEGVLCTLKHFPGHGSSTTDSHYGLTDVTDTWRRIELEPFARLIREGMVDAVMTAHIFHAGLDPERPATLSSPIIKGILRNELGFDGVVFSDDMQMQAITDHYGFETAVLAAIEADVDILVFGNNLAYDPQIARKATALILGLIAEEKISEERIDRSWRRIAALKARLTPAP